jgi:hypothetical protein
VLGRVALHRGSVISAKAAIGLDQPAPGLGVDVVEWVRALLLDAQGDPGEGRRSLASAWDRLEPVRYFGTWPSIGSDLLRLHLRAGDRTGATTVTRAIEAGAAGSEAVSASGAALCCRALLEHDPPLIRQGEGGRSQPSQRHRSHRPAASGPGNLRNGRCHGRHHASAIRAATTRDQPGHTRFPPAPADRVEQPDPRRTSSGRPRRRRTHHPPDRRPPPRF